MKTLGFGWLLLVCPLLALGQTDTSHVVHFTPSLLDSVKKEIIISTLDGWRFHPGNDTTWATSETSGEGWMALKPSQVSADMADVHGKAEGWFRLDLDMDSAFSAYPVGLRVNTWAALELYVNGRLMAAFGPTLLRPSEYQPFPSTSFVPIPLPLKPGQINRIAIHFTDSLSPYQYHRLRSEFPGSNNLIRLTGPHHLDYFNREILRLTIYTIVWITVALALAILSWIFVLLNPLEKILPLIAGYTTCLALNVFIVTYANNSQGTTFHQYLGFYHLSAVFTAGFFVLTPVILVSVMRRELNAWLRLTLVFLAFILLATSYFPNTVDLVPSIVLAVVCAYLILSSWRTLHGAQWAVVVGLVITLIWTILFGIGLITHEFSFIFPNSLLYLTGIYISFPFSLFVYLALRFKEVLQEVRHNAEQVVSLMEEKKTEAERQQQVLEKEVARQTVELRTSLENLKATQSQLIQSEKMASLGELTAGIAHEIQNPLNFVNNFSEINSELISELKSAMSKGNLDEVKSIAATLEENENKIVSHGKRADAIVKGMLQHSRKSTGQKELTDINALCDEYLRLAYHGLRAKDKSFNAKFETHLDPNLPKINVVPQEIGRVVLNLINNAFYACTERSRSERSRSDRSRSAQSQEPKDNSQQPIANSQNPDSTYEPTVMVSTRSLGNKIEISVTDNGPGIPDNIKDKIFQPFFTTKPTGQGTGLGLSLSYDIIKGHNGTLTVESTGGTGSTFTIQLPQ